MDGYLLDTNMISYWYDEEKPEHDAVRQHIESLPNASPLAISVITLGEIEYGHRCVSETDTIRQRDYSRFIVTQIPRVLDISRHAGKLYGQVRAEAFNKWAESRKHKRPEQLVDPVTGRELGIQENDLWICAQALEQNLVLVTNDNMARIREVTSELQVENWARS